MERRYNNSHATVCPEYIGLLSIKVDA